MGMWSRKIPGKKTWILPLLHHAPLLYPGAHWPGWFRPHETISWRFDFSGRSCGVSLQLLDRVEWKQKGRNHSETRKHAIYVHVLEARHPTYGWTMLNNVEHITTIQSHQWENSESQLSNFWDLLWFTARQMLPHIAGIYAIIPRD